MPFNVPLYSLRLKMLFRIYRLVARHQCHSSSIPFICFSAPGIPCMHETKKVNWMCHSVSISVPTNNNITVDVWPCCHPEKYKYKHNRGTSCLNNGLEVPTEIPITKVVDTHTKNFLEFYYFMAWLALDWHRWALRASLRPFAITSRELDMNKKKSSVFTSGENRS